MGSVCLVLCPIVVLHSDFHRIPPLSTIFCGQILVDQTPRKYGCRLQEASLKVVGFPDSIRKTLSPYSTSISLGRGFCISRFPAIFTLFGHTGTCPDHASPHLWAQPPRFQSMSLNSSQISKSASLKDETTSVPPKKPIRFVFNDGQPHSKRRRINAACHTCRRRKTRCSGERPSVTFRILPKELDH